MKPTVDLTADRMFPDVEVVRVPPWMLGKHDTSGSIVKLVTSVSRVPWEHKYLNVSISDESTDWRFQLSGSAEEYRQREEWRKSDSIDYCDRCGNRIRTPWRYDRSLCDTCSTQLEVEVKGHKVPWEDSDFHIVVSSS